MGFSSVYRSLMEIFPQIDARLLRAVAIEHPKDADEAAAVVLSDIVPSLPSNLSHDSTHSWNKSSGSISEREVERGLEDVVSRCRGLLVASGSKSSASSSSETTPLVVGRRHDTSAPSTKLVSNGNELTKLPLKVGRGGCHKDVESEEVQSLSKAPGKEQENDIFGKCFDVPSAAQIDLHVPEDDRASVVSAVTQDNAKSISDFWQDLGFHMTWNQAESNTSIGSLNAEQFFEDNMTNIQQGPCFEVGTGSTNDETSKGSLTSVNGDTESKRSLASVNGDTESKRSLASVNGDTESKLSLASVFGDTESKRSLASVNGDTESKRSLASVNGDTESKRSLASVNGDTESKRSLASVNGDTESKRSLGSVNGDTELGGGFSSSTHGCSVDHLEEIIEDAKTNKKTLLTVMDSVMNLMKEVELGEKDAEKSELEAARGCLDTLEKVEELKKMLEHAKEANDMHAGEVYGEKSILATEAKELENRLLNLSEERDKSLAVLDEMRETLEIRLAAALEMKKAAEQEKKVKEASALKALAEQEAIMEKVVQESKLLQQEAEENSKLREFLMDRGQVVDSLQGEISVICQDVKLLKEKFDNRVSITKSIPSSLTSSCGSSMRSLVLETPAEPLNGMLETSSINKSPEEEASPSMNKERDDCRELLEDGWDMFDKELNFKVGWC